MKAITLSRHAGMLGAAIIAFTPWQNSSAAEVFIVDFTNDDPIERSAAYDPGLTNLNTTGWQQNTTNSGTSHTFRYDILGSGLGDADELRVAVSTSNGTSTMRPAAGNGIAVNGGDNDNWWDPGDNVDLNFAVSILNAGGTDITPNFNIDLTGVAMRWAEGESATFAGTPVTNTSGSAILQGIDLPIGENSETSFSFKNRTTDGSGNPLAQVQQLRFAIATGPDLIGPGIASFSPADDSFGVPVGTSLGLTFNEDVGLTGVGTITLRDLGDGADTIISLPDARVFLSDPRTLVIDPSSDLIPNNSYAVLISADALVDQAAPPNAFDGILDDVTWNFTTGGPPPEGPNVIVFLVDDLGLTDVQQHPTYFPDGSPLFETPNIHRLASEGMRFNHVYAQPLCSASRACLLSGQDIAAREKLYMAVVGNSVPNPSLPSSSAPSSPHNHPTDRDHLPLAVETIAERLKAAGYATWHAGKWHLSPASNGSNPNPVGTYYPDKQGFDKQLSVGGSGPSSYFGPFNGIPNMVDHLGNPAPGAKGDHIGDHMQKLVQDTIDHHLANDPSRPFFLYYPAYSVHAPHEAKRSLFNYYQNKLAGLANSKHQHPVMAAQIHSADDELGQMLDYLDGKGLVDNTLLIFVSDNGGLSIEQQSGSVFDDIGADGIPDDDPANTVNGDYAKSTAPIDASIRMTNMDPRRAGKGSLFEGGLRVPMIIRFPNGGIPADTGTDEPVHLTDLYRTILDYTPAEALPGQTLDGLSLKPVLEQSATLPERDIIIHFPRNNETWGPRFLSKGYPDPDNYPFNVYPGGTAVIRHPFKLIARYSTAHDAATVDYQLYSLDADEGEQFNVAGDFPETVDAMRDRLEAYYQATAALVPTPNPNYNGTSVNSPEITPAAYFAEKGLTPGTPEAFLLADPDSDTRRNENEFLGQTDPTNADPAPTTIWLRDKGTFEELRFAVPATAVQSSIEVLDAAGNVALAPGSGLALDAQYGKFYVYRPSNPAAGETPSDYRVALTRTEPGPSATPDADGDLLPDDYELANGLDPADPADGNADNDGDGDTRGQEYLAGTSDFDPNERMLLSLTEEENSALRLDFNVRDGKSYALYKSRDLSAWTLWEDFGAVSGDHPVSLPVSEDHDSEFFRLRAYQP